MTKGDMKTAYVMYCCDKGEYELWFDSDKNLLDGYFLNDADWRDEYFNYIFEKLGIKIERLKYDASIAKKSRKKLWGL